MDEKKELLKLHDKDINSEKNLSLKVLILAYLIIMISLCLSLPKIYIANQIYHLSKDISDISTKKDVLMEENSALKIKLENLHYKNQILTPMQIN